MFPVVNGLIVDYSDSIGVVVPASRLNDWGLSNARSWIYA